MGDKKTVLIVEDHRLLRDGLKAMLSAEKDYDVIGEAKDGQDAIRQITGSRPDLVLLDINMPKVDGFSVLRAIKKDSPGTRVLMLTVHESDQYVHEAFRAGADGYCLKDSSREEMLLAMRSALAGKMFISPSVAKSVMGGYLSGHTAISKKSAWESLTPREKEVLKLIAESFQNKEIAQILGISVKTVEKHRGNLIEKLDLHSSTALTAFAYEHGLVKRNS
ncbi:MAG TPA: response regulator transcription factor [Bryobacteraceae bacterium]|nr:response regulator transcription factor [Bryobacteraceae bacterium]